eukprot:6205495-Pleurochrysis_carterae.AAC.1
MSVLVACLVRVGISAKTRIGLPCTKPSGGFALLANYAYLGSCTAVHELSKALQRMLHAQLALWPT